MKYLFVSLVAFMLASCSIAPGQQYSQSTRANYRVNAVEVGKRIWQNECGGKVEGLVHWNVGEPFPSLGIGHFIWFPRGLKVGFGESFPKFVEYAESRGVKVPAFMHGPAPWPNRAAFLRDRSGKADAMRHWLANNIGIQSAFIMKRSRESLPAILKASDNPKVIYHRFRALASTTQGMYCLVDYVNFKGEGLKKGEGYRGQNWGLLQVLEEMRGFPQGRAATAEFSRAAAVVLTRRVRNSPPGKGEKRWLQGWLNRCATYR